MSRVFLNQSPPYVLKQGLSLNVDLINLARLAGQCKRSLISTTHHFGVIDAMPAFEHEV